MERHEEGGTLHRQPPQEIQLYQHLNNSTSDEVALAYARYGWPVLPLHSVQNGHCTCGAAECRSPGKHPHTARGVLDATTDLERIEQWWTDWPDANIGIATGAVSGLVVVDVDPRNGGTESLEQLQAAHGVLNTYTVATGGGGWHFYFKHPGGHIPCHANLEAGIDAKADGGLVVAAPSLHLSGARYRIEQDVPVAELPHWLQARLSESYNGAESLSTIGVALCRLRVSAPIKRLIAEGDQAGAYASRSEAVFAVIRAMIMAGHSDEEIGAVLVNPAHPIGEKAREKGFAWLQGEIARARAKAHVNGGQSSAESGSTKALAHPPLRLLTIEEVKARPKPEWLIEPLVPQGALCVMFGPSGHGKSFLALEWALSIGSGVKPLGHAISHGPVVYVAAEGAAGIKQRLIAWEKARGSLASNVWFIEHPIHLLDKQTASTLVDVIERTLPTRPILIIIDTLARCFVDGDENLAKDANRAVATLDEMRGRTGACILVVHHSGKGNSSMERGSSALRGAADTMILVERRYGTIEVKIDKQKDAEAAEPNFLKLTPHADSCVLKRAPTGISLTKHQKTIGQLLAEKTAPLSRKALCEAWGQTGRSQSTFDRAFRKVKDLRAISEGDHGGYEITEIGRLLS